jgi:GlpG protein
MRRIARLARPPAERLADLLAAEGIRHQLDEEPEGDVSVWVHDEAEVPRAKGLFADFTADPERASSPAIRAAAERARRESRAESRDVEVVRPAVATRSGIGPLTLALIVASIAVTIATRMGTDMRGWRWLAMTNIAEGGYHLGLPEIRHGQVWRLFTPMFVHLGPLHILFNMIWLRDLGTVIERTRGTLFTLGLVLAIAAGSNLAQYVASGPLFGGMSGVVYGLLGYIWITSRLEPFTRLWLSQQTVIWMLGWLVLCFTGLMGPVANWAHLAGLVLGMAIAAAHAWWNGRRRRR